MRRIFIFILLFLLSENLQAQQVQDVAMENAAPFSQAPQPFQMPQLPASELAPQQTIPSAMPSVKEGKKTLAIFDAKKPTPSRFFTSDISIPDHFSTSNNLVKKVGSFYRAFGEVIFIKGTITDSFGVPVEGAVIEIWQANSAGKYHTLLDADSEYIDKYFNMSGRAITNNLGAYDFITIMPGASTSRAPHINMNIYHPKFGKLETEMYFEEHPYNATDYQYLAYSEEDAKLLTAQVRRVNLIDQNSIKVCTFNIVMRGVHQYKQY